MIDLTYHNFGRLTVIGRDYSYPSGSGKSIYWSLENNIPLVRIKYDEELTEEKLDNYINKKNLTK